MWPFCYHHVLKGYIHILCFDCTFLDDVTSSLQEMIIVKIDSLSQHDLTSEHLEDSIPYPLLITLNVNAVTLFCKHFKSQGSWFRQTTTTPLPPLVRYGWDFNFEKLKSLGEEIFIPVMGCTSICGAVIIVIFL